MTERLLLSLFSALIILSGCVASGPSIDTKNSKIDNRLVYPQPPEEPRFYYERTLRGSLDVLPPDEDGLLRRALTGEKRSAEGLAKPYGVAVHHGVVYVGDTIAHSVAVFDIPNQKYFKIGLEADEDGHGKLGSPIGLDVDKAGNLYVLDAKYKQVMIFSPDGKFLRSIGDDTMFYKPAGLAVTPDGTRVYGVDIGGSSSDEHKIVVLNGVTGQRLPDIGKRGDQDGEFNLPRDVVIAPDGSIYVVDGGNFRVQRFDKDGKFMSKFGDIGRQMGQFSRPKEAAVDPEGNIYVVDTAFGNFQIFNPLGQILLAIGNRSNSNAPGLYSLPSGIAVDDDGRVYVVDQFFRKVDIFRPASLPEDGGWIGPITSKMKPASASK